MSQSIEPDYLNIVQSCLCTNLRRISRAVTSIYNSHLKKANLKATQFTMLVAIALKNESNLTELADLLFIDSTTLSRSLERLEKRELISLEIADDRRNRIVKLTEVGKQTILSAIPYWENAQNEVKEIIGSNTFYSFLDDLGSLAERFQK